MKKRTIYGKATKAKIIQAASSARSQGKTWKQALEAAKKVGYSGTADGLYQMLRGEGKKAKPAASKKVATKPVAAKTIKRVLPPVILPKPAAPQKAGTLAMIIRLRQKRTQLDVAIRALEALGED